MQIRRDPSFVRALKKLDKQKRRTVFETIEIFSENPLDPRLKKSCSHRHSKRSSGHLANSNLRNHFKEFDDYLVVVLLMPVLMIGFIVVGGEESNLQTSR